MHGLNWLRLARTSSIGIQGFNKLQQKMLQTSDTVEPCGISVVPLPFDLMDSTLDVSEPAAKDLAIVALVLALDQAQTFLPTVVACVAFFDRPIACFPLARELRIAHA